MPVSGRRNISIRECGANNDEPRLVQYSKSPEEEAFVTHHVPTEYFTEQRSQKLSF